MGGYDGKDGEAMEDVEISGPSNWRCRMPIWTIKVLIIASTILVSRVYGRRVQELYSIPKKKSLVTIHDSL